MTTAASSFQQNLPSEKKTVDVVHKDIKKWVDSVVEFKANLDKKKEPPLEKHIKKIKKFKVKKKGSLSAMPSTSPKNSILRKNIKPKKSEKEGGKMEKPHKEQSSVVDKFDEIKEFYRTVKLPHNWTSGVSSGRIVFNRIQLTTLNSQQKMTVERSLIITKDCTTHVLINGSEIIMNNWDMHKINTVEDLKRAIKDVDALKICEGPANGMKSPQCYIFIDGQNKTCAACKTEAATTEKGEKSMTTTKKKVAPAKRKVTKKKSYQK